MRLDAATLALRPRIPVDIVDLILPQIPESTLVTEIPSMMRCNKDHSLEIATLNLQIDFLFLEVDKLNPYFWMMLATCAGDSVLDEPTQEENKRYLQQTKVPLRRNAPYWVKTPGAIEFLKEKLMNQP
ncbi:uncharacterized protein N7483_001391 [Penicillium malachiteum]|uniref:uncharacterized protein n=1 Tax=Penicillium malachiteum TaxID=1324776 RepID=UPI002548FFF4|nr:uncharacterized protein N7483_001391 [Penicillium malachiteum]KAJ5736266.1 hypothetical protein N7483_001391 [Penicillium malachiteum]